MGGKSTHSSEIAEGLEGTHPTVSSLHACHAATHARAHATTHARTKVKAKAKA